MPIKNVNLSAKERENRRLEQIRQYNLKKRTDPELRDKYKKFHQSYYQYRKAFKELCSIKI